MTAWRKAEVKSFGHEQSEARDLSQYVSAWNTNGEIIVEGEDSSHHRC